MADGSSQIVERLLNVYGNVKINVQNSLCLFMDVRLPHGPKTDIVQGVAVAFLCSCCCFIFYGRFWAIIEHDRIVG